MAKGTASLGSSAGEVPGHCDRATQAGKPGAATLLTSDGCGNDFASPGFMNSLCRLPRWRLVDSCWGGSIRAAMGNAGGLRSCPSGASDIRGVHRRGGGLTMMRIARG